MISWKQIPGFETRYQVSDCGQVRNAESGLILKQHLNRDGYPRLNIKASGGCKKPVEVHRLVALAFLSGKEEDSVVNHIDGNKANNSASNLEWCSVQENTAHAFRAGLAVNKSRPGTVPANRKGVVQLAPNGSEVATHPSIRAAAKAVGCHPSLVSRICSGTYSAFKGQRFFLRGMAA